jgi:hypothetical protein
MPRALEVFDATLRRIEQGEIDGISALDQLLDEERRLLHHAVMIQIGRTELSAPSTRRPCPRTLRAKPLAAPPPTQKRRGRPPGKSIDDLENS